MDGSPPDPKVYDLLDYWKCHRPLGAHIFDFGSAEILKMTQGQSQIIVGTHSFGKSHNLRHRKFRKLRVPTSP